MIKDRVKKIIKILTTIFTILIPGLALAVSENDLGNTTIIKPGAGSDFKIASLVAKGVTYILGFTGAIATLFIIYGGLKYVTSNGNSEQIDSAKKILLYAILGLLVIALSYVIVKSVTVVANQII